MSEMILPGRNELVICGAALCAIVENHLRSACYSSKQNIRVERVVSQVDHGAPTFRFEITTDPKEGT